MDRGDGIGEGFAFLILVVGVVAVIVLVARWVLAIVCISGALLGWLWRMWKGDGPGEVERVWRCRFAPLWHYPFIGVGSVIASMAGAVAVHEIVRGADPALPGSRLRLDPVSFDGVVPAAASSARRASGLPMGCRDRPPVECARDDG